MLDTRLLTFLTLLEEKSYTKTAAKLNFTQPAVTHHIKAIEKEYEITLFLNSKTFELTRAGKILLGYAKECKLQHEFLVNNLKKEELETHIKLGLTEMASHTLLSNNFIRIFNQSISNYNTYIYSNQELQGKILAGEIDMGVVDNSFDSSKFESIYLCSSKIILVCKANGKYQKERITREMLQSATIILCDKESGLCKSTLAALNNKNIKLKNNPILESNNLDLIINLIETNDAIGFVYEDSVRPYIESGKLKKIELLNFQPTQNFYLLYNRVSYFDEKILKLLELLKNYGENK